MKEAYERFGLVAVLVATTAVFPFGAAAQPFVAVQLPRGVTIELPKNWVVLSNNQRITLDSSASSRLDLSGIEHESSDLPFAANCYDDRGNVIGIVNIRYYPTLDITQDDARKLSPSDVEELDSTLKANLVRSLKASGMSMTSWEGTKRTELNQIAAFVTEYHRRSIKSTGDCRVRLVRVFAADRSFTLTVSYLEPVSFLIEPITDRIIHSLMLSGTRPSPASPNTKGSAGGSAMSVLFGEGWAVTLLLSFVATWGIGLAPPILVRYVIIRRPIGKAWAIGIVGCFWVFNILLFSLLSGRSSGHGSLALVAIVSYAILRRSDKVKVLALPQQ